MMWRVIQSVISLASFILPLTVSMHAWLQSPYFRDGNGLLSYGNFTRHTNTYLSVTKLDSCVVEGPIDCTFKCIGEPRCLSFNLAANPDSDGHYLCDLLATDKYRATAMEVQASDAFHHYSPWSLCEEAPCQPNRICIPDHKLNTYQCPCQPGFIGRNCEQKGKSCSEIKYYSTYATSGSYVIDPDGDGGREPFTVFCNMTEKNGVGVTVVSHDTESRTHVNGYEGIGSYVRNVHYQGAAGITSVAQAASITDVSTNCEQFIKYECFSSYLSLGWNAWWVSHSGAKMTYWGGATPDDPKKCACGVTSSCADSAHVCNCDINDATWREDSGLLTEKSHLPVTQLGTTSKKVIIRLERSSVTACNKGE